MRFQQVLFIVLSFILGCGSESGTNSDEQGLASSATPVSGKKLILTALAAHKIDRVDDFHAVKLKTHTRGNLSSPKPDEISTTTIFKAPRGIHEYKQFESDGGAMSTTYIQFQRTAWLGKDNEQLQRVQAWRWCYDEAPFGALTRLRQICDGNRFEYRYGGKKQVDGKTLRVVQILRDLEPVCEVHIDNSTRLVVCLKKEEYNPLTDRVGQSETFFSNFEIVEGIVLPITTTGFLDGEKFQEITLVEFETLNDLDDNIFRPSN